MKLYQLILLVVSYIVLGLSFIWGFVLSIIKVSGNTELSWFEFNTLNSVWSPFILATIIFLVILSLFLTSKFKEYKEKEYKVKEALKNMNVKCK